MHQVKFLFLALLPNNDFNAGSTLEEVESEDDCGNLIMPTMFDQKLQYLKLLIKRFGLNLDNRLQ